MPFSVALPHIHFHALRIDLPPDQVPGTMEDEAAGPTSSSKNRRRFPELTQQGLDLRSLISIIRWVCLDQSNLWRACRSWSIFFALVIGVPLASHLVCECSSCDYAHRCPYNAIVQSSLSIVATISFLCLTAWRRRYGLRRLLFLDKLCDVSEKVRDGYAEELQRSKKLLCLFVLPGFIAETIYKIWWYTSGAEEIPYFGNMGASDTIICILMLCSWLYRTTLYFFVCLLLRLTCCLQILRLDDFGQIFQVETDVDAIMKGHFSIRRNLRVISHRFRAFILLSLLLVTASQFCALLKTTRTSIHLNIFKTGELALCSISLVAGILICLRSATKITHKAQSITSLAARWHVFSTIDSYDDEEGDKTTTSMGTNQVFILYDSDKDEDDDADNTKILPHFASTMSFQKRHALVTYLENNKAGITVFGFALDRSWNRTIFITQLGLLLWLLNKTIGIS